jgi:hypothetical protein
MALINVGASFPQYMWAVTRLMLASGGKLAEKDAKLLLTPPSLTAGENDEYNVAVKTLADLDIVTRVDGIVALGEEARTLSSDDVTGFNGLLRRAALDPARNAGLAETDDLGGAKDLMRALAWFLTQDPATSLDWGAAASLQDGAFPSHLPPPFANSARWDYFVYWAPALGFAASPLLNEGLSTRLVPDCTVAVRETVLGLWNKGQSVNPSEAVNRIVEALPVLPGGAYSRSLGLTVPDGAVPSSLSNALLTGHEVGWITLDQQSDAADVIFLTDSGGTRTGVSNLTINGSD